MGLAPIKDYEYEYCKFDGAVPIATFMFSNLSRRNALHTKTTEGLENAVQVVRENDDIRVLVITGDTHVHMRGVGVLQEIERKLLIKLTK